MDLTALQRAEALDYFETLAFETAIENAIDRVDTEAKRYKRNKKRRQKKKRNRKKKKDVGSK